MDYTKEQFKEIIFGELSGKRMRAGYIWRFNEYSRIGMRLTPPMDIHEFQFHMGELVSEGYFYEEDMSAYRLTEKCDNELYPKD